LATLSLNKRQWFTLAAHWIPQHPQCTFFSYTFFLVHWIMSSLTCWFEKEIHFMCRTLNSQFHLPSTITTIFSVYSSSSLWMIFTVNPSLKFIFIFTVPQNASKFLFFSSSVVWINTSLLFIIYFLKIYFFKKLVLLLFLKNFISVYPNLTFWITNFTSLV
jgi:hypothetical protein